MHTHRDLDVWRRALDLASHVYDATQSFPAIERWGLANQARRAAVSVASNIAEGAARGTRTHFTHFLRIARGSLAELETQLILAERLGFLAGSPNLLDEIASVGKMISGLIRALSEPADHRR
jgi:four helix bundle protein